MHPKIYREFHLSFASGIDGESPLYVSLRHTSSGRETVLMLPPTGESPDRCIEKQVMLQFPDTAAAAELRSAYGLTLHHLRENWAIGFGDRLLRALAERADSKGAALWAELIPTLPPVLYSTMTSRAVAALRQLGETVEQRAAIRRVRDAWANVLHEARDIRLKLTGLQRLALVLYGWPTDQLQSLPLLEFSRLKEKAMFARLSLDYLTEEDWAAIVAPLLVLAKHSATPHH
jgi:hypothetical protein